MSDLIHARIIADRHHLGTDHADELAALITELRPHRTDGTLDGRGVILGPGGTVVARTYRAKTAAYVDEEDSRRLGLMKREVGMVLARLGEGHAHESMHGLYHLTGEEHARKAAEVEASRAGVAAATDEADAAFRAAEAAYQEAARARREAIRAEVAAGASMYSVAKRLGVTAPAIAKLVRD